MSFDQLAPFYRTLETLAFGNALQRARSAFLEEVPDCRRALIVGEGNGGFLKALLRRHPNLDIDCVDESGIMLTLARKRVRGYDGVRFYKADIREWHASCPNEIPALEHGGYDLIVTHFFLDCFTNGQLPEVVAKIAAMAAPRACWLVADFHLPPAGASRVHARIWLGAMYKFFRLTTGIYAGTLADFAPSLRAAGFNLRKQKSARWGLLRTQVWERS